MQPLSNIGRITITRSSIIFMSYRIVLLISLKSLASFLSLGLPFRHVTIKDIVGNPVLLHLSLLTKKFTRDEATFQTGPTRFPWFTVTLYTNSEK